MCPELIKILKSSCLVKARKIPVYSHFGFAKSNKKMCTEIQMIETQECLLFSNKALEC